MKTGITNEKGVALIGTIGLLLVLVTMGMAFLKMSAYESDSAALRYNQLRAFWKAEEALSRARAQMDHVQEPDGYQGATLDDESEPFTAKIAVKKVPQADFYAYEILGEVYFKDDGTRPFFSLSSVEKPKTFSDPFMLFDNPGDYPQSSPYFDTGDLIDGHLHCNTFLTITGSPIFLGLVTTGDPFPGYKARPFQFYTPPAKIENTGEIFPIPRVAEKLREQAFWIVPGPEQRAIILFTGTGYVLKIRDLHNEAMVFNKGGAEFVQGKSSSLFVDGDVEVSGVLSGKVTVGCSGNLYITDNITYADADQATGQPRPDSKNILGLISEGNVFVKQKQVSPYIGNGIIIDASILAMDSTVQVLNYRDYQQSMGVMHLWGNVVQYQRGIIGNVRLRGTVEMGYHKDWHHDTRLQTLQPPCMPPLKDEKGNMRFKTIYWKRSDV